MLQSLHYILPREWTEEQLLEELNNNNNNRKDKPGIGSQPYVISSLCNPDSCGLIISSYVPSCLSINVL